MIPDSRRPRRGGRGRRVCESCRPRAPSPGPCQTGQGSFAPWPEGASEETQSWGGEAPRGQPGSLEGVWRAGSPSTAADLRLLHPGGLQGGCAQSSAHPVWSFPCHVSVGTAVHVWARMCARFCACACVGVRMWASPCVPVPVPVCAGARVRACYGAEVVLCTHHGSQTLTSGEGCWARRPLKASPCPGAALAAILRPRASPAVSRPGPGARAESAVERRGRPAPGKPLSPRVRGGRPGNASGRGTQPLPPSPASGRVCAPAAGERQPRSVLGPVGTVLWVRLQGRGPWGERSTIFSACRRGVSEGLQKVHVPTSD